MFAAVPLGVSCFLSSWVGGYCVAGTLGRRQVVSSRHSDTSGRCVMRALLVFWGSGAGGMGANAVHKKSKFFCGGGGFQNKRALLSAAVKGLNS